MKKRWLLAIVVGVPALLLAVTWLVVHLPSVQRDLFRRVTDEVRTTTGLVVDAEHVALRVWPARLEIEGLRVEGRTAPLLTVDQLETRWRWRKLLASPPRVDTVTVGGLVVDVGQMPDLPPTTGETPPTTVDPWKVVEIGRLELRHSAASGALEGIDWRVEGLGLAGFLHPGEARVSATAETVEVVKDGRRLRLGPVGLEVSADPVRGLELERFEAEGSPASLRLHGSAKPGEPPQVAVAGRLEVDPSAVIGWWDPELLGGVGLAGRLDLDLEAQLEGLDRVRFEAVHRGAPVVVAGLALETLAVSGDLSEVEAELGGGGWGRATGTWRRDAGVTAAVSLEGARPEPVVSALGLPWPERLDRGLVVDGRVDVAGPLPPTLGSLSGSADLRGAVEGAEVELEASVAEGGVTVARLEALVAGASVLASGRGSLDGAVEGRLEVAAPDLGELVATLDGWLPAEVVELGLGGTVEAHGAVDGTIEAPGFEVAATWVGPRIAGVGGERIDVEAAGDRLGVDWTAGLVMLDGVEAHAAGRTLIEHLSTSGTWRVAVGDLRRVGELGLPIEVPPLSGAVSGDGVVAWVGDVWSAEGRIDASTLGWQDWRVPSASLRFAARPEAVVLRDLSIELGGGRIAGSGEVPIADLDGPLRLDLAWLGIDLAALPLTLPPEVHGTVGGSVGLEGTLADPIGSAEVEWVAAAPDEQPVDRCRLVVSLDGGVLRAVSDPLTTDLGEVDLRLTAPLGDLPRPDWLLRGVPGGAVRASARLEGVSTSQLLAATGQASSSIVATGDLLLDLEWLPPDLAGLQGELRLDNLRITSPYETFSSQEPLLVELRPGHVTVPHYVLEAPNSRIELGGSYDLVSETVNASVAAELSADAARLLPVPAGARGAMKLGLELHGPLARPEGRVAIDHRGGTITLRDPALEISDLYVEAAVEGGVLVIDRGSAGVNRGRVEFGGGWDPESGQGVVAELENVVLLLPGGILTAWSGNLAIEPETGRLARVVGELVLESGLWDSPVSLTSSFFGGSGLDVGTEEMLYDIGLDLQVRGRRGVRVENNLGDLEVSWSTLRVTGTAAEPIVRGDLKIAPGGRITVAGQEVTVRRGTIRMTGDPATDPQIEIVPEQDLASYEAGAQGSGSQLDAQLLATKGVARGVGSALGFENETLQPAEISIETETASASSFSIGQRLTSNIALLLTTDLANTASRTTMVQLWNFNRLPGLAAQLYESTDEEGSGANLIQRFRWGGTAPADDRPTIHRLKFEGEWPISGRRARKATGLQRGQPYDPFLLFAARIRLERELAGLGYHLARVDGRTEGSERSPTLVFSCEAGPLTTVRFDGDVPPRRVRQEVTALYQPPPLDGPAMSAMREALLRHAWSEGHAAAEVEVERHGGEVVATVTLGPDAEFTGPFLHGFPPEVEEPVRTLLSTPTELAAALEEPDRAERAVRRILESRGWQEARLRSVTGHRGSAGEVEVHLDLDAGARERIAEIRTRGDDPLGLLSPDRLALSAGDPVDRLVLEQAMSSIRFAYVEAGYADVQLHSKLVPADAGGWDLELELLPGLQRRVAETRVVGLRHTSERVVRHGLTLEPGDVLRPSEIDRSVVAIGTFAPIERVDVRTIPAGPGREVVELEVTEKPRWTVEAGAGWSTERGSELRLGLRDDNLFHRGFGLNLRARWQASEQLGLLIFSLPPLPGSRWRLGSTLRYYDGPNPENPDEYDQVQYSASLEATFERSTSDTLRGYYEVRRTTNTYVCPDPNDPFCFVDESTVVESIIGGAFFRDRMDNLFDPRKGYTLTMDVSSNRPQVGSDLSDTRLSVGSGLALEPRDGWTWAQSVQLGWARGWNGYELAPTRKFYAGGQGSIRGFDKDSVGPVDATLVTRGGSALFVLNEELRIPVWGPVRAAVFVDAGQVWETWSDADLRLSVGAGLGVRISTPIGPIWGDVAWPVANVNDLTKRGAKFYLGIGRPF